MHRSKEQVSDYVELVTGTVPPSSAVDCAGYLYGVYNLLNEIHDMCKTHNPYQVDLACRRIHNVQESLLVNAKHYEGIDVQLKLF